MSPPSVALLLDLLDFPIPLHQDLLSLYASPNSPSAYAYGLARNRSFAPTAIDLVRAAPNTASVLAIAPHSNETILDAALSLPPSHRIHPKVLLKYWDLSTEDQCRLLKRNLDQGLADDLLVAGLLDPSVLPILAPRCSLPYHLEYLVKDTASSDDIWDVLRTRPIAKRSFKAVVATLLARPNLRVRALESGVPSLIAAACWTPLPYDQQSHALDLALAHANTNPLSLLSPIVGLLSIPGLNPELRPVAKLAYDSSRLLYRVEKGSRPINIIRCPAEMHNDPRPMSEWSRTLYCNAVEFLSSLISRPPHRQRELLALMLFSELSTSPHLDDARAHSLLSDLARLPAVISNQPTPSLPGVLRNILDAPGLSLDARIALRHTVSSTTYLRRAVLSDLLRRPSAPAPKRSIKRAVPEPKCSPVSRPAIDAALDDPAWPTLDRSVLASVAPFIRSALGDATSVESRQSWNYFLDLVTTRESVSLRHLCEAARTLSYADCALDDTYHMLSV